MQQPVREGIGEVVDDLVGGLAREQHPSGLLDGLCADRVGLLSQRADGGACVMSAQLGHESRHFLLEQPARVAGRGLTLAAVLFDDVLQIVDREEVHVGELGHRGLDVARHREIDHENRAVPPLAHRRRGGALGDQGYGARRAAHHDVRLDELLLQAGQVDRVGLDLGGERLRACERAIGDHEPLHPRACEMPGGQIDHLARADHERGALAQVRVHPPREADGRGGEGDRVGADLRLGADALCGRKRGLKELVERGAGAAGLLRHAIGILELAQDLRLAQHHGVESRGDGEGMRDGELFLMNIEARGEVQVVAVMILEPLRQLCRARIARPVHFRAIARREDHHLGDAELLPQGAQRRGEAIFVERHFLAQRKRRGLMVEAENVECHERAVLP